MLFAVIGVIHGSFEEARVDWTGRAGALLWFMVGMMLGSQGSTLTIPDGLEYVTAAHRFAAGHGASLLLAGNEYPSRYLPWFSEFFLAPSYYLGDGSAVEAYRIPVGLFFGLALMASSALGRLLAGAAGGAICPLFALLVPALRHFGREPMTDVPGAVAVLCLAIQAVRPRLGITGILESGVLTAAAAACRPLYAVLVIPSVLLPQVKRSWKGAAMVPLAILVAASFEYQRRTFGSPFRSGYNFWTSVPYDYLGLTFSWSYLVPNIRVLSADAVLFPLAGVACYVATLLVARRPPFDDDVFRDRVLHASTAISTLVATIVPLHLFYFWSSPRFFLGIELVGMIIVSSVLALAVERRAPAWMRLAWPLVAGVALLITAWARDPSGIGEIDFARRIATELPPRAVLVSGMNPLAASLGGLRAEFVPVSRRVEFASKYVTRAKVPRERIAPRSPLDHRATGLREGGAEEVYAAAAIEKPEYLERKVREGIPVFIESAFLKPEELGFLEGRFLLEPAARELYRIVDVVERDE